MRLHAGLLFCLIITVSSYGQGSSPCDNLLKLDSATGAYSRMSKEDLVISKNAKDVLRITVLFIDRTVIISFTVPDGVYCVDETCKIDITFADGVELQMPNNGKFNCDGDLSLFFYGAFGNKKEFGQLLMSPVQKVKVGLRKSVVEKNRENFIEAVIPEDKAKILMQTLNCLVE
jgi:hypothetical protein